MAKKNKRTKTAIHMSSMSARNEFNPDYTYVKRDLARIGTLAVFFFAALVVISFFLK